MIQHACPSSSSLLAVRTKHMLACMLLVAQDRRNQLAERRRWATMLPP